MSRSGRRTEGSLTELRRDLNQLGENVERAVINELKDMANKTHKTAVREAPIDNENPSKIHLHEVISQKVSDDGLHIAIGATKRIIGLRLFRIAGWYAHFVLGGSKGGVITSGPYRGAILPPRPPNNYMQRAFDQHAGEYISRMGKAAARAVRLTRGRSGPRR